MVTIPVIDTVNCSIPASLALYEQVSRPVAKIPELGQSYGKISVSLCSIIFELVISGVYRIRAAQLPCVVFVA